MKQIFQYLMNIRNGFLFFITTTQFMVFTYKIWIRYFVAVLLTCFMISIMHEDFRRAYYMGLFLFSLDSKIYANGIHLLSQWKYVCSLKQFCKGEERGRRKKKQCPGNAKAKGRSLFFISILPKMFYHGDVLLSLFHYLLRLTSVPAHKMPKQWSSKMHKSQWINAQWYLEIYH